jgi:hypothetical protein
MTDHPYQPGTVWAPKPRSEEKRVKQPRPNRKIVECPRDAADWWPGATVWYITDRNPVPVQTNVRSFAQWAGERITT